MLACQKKTDSLLCIYKGETRHLLSFCVPCSSLSLWHPRYLVYWIHAVWISSKLQQAFKEKKPPNIELCFILLQLCALLACVQLRGTNKMIWSWCKKKLQKENQLTWGPTLCWLWTLLFSWYFYLKRKKTNKALVMQRAQHFDLCVLLHAYDVWTRPHQ